MGEAHGGLIPIGYWNDTPVEPTDAPPTPRSATTAATTRGDTEWPSPADAVDLTWRHEGYGAAALVEAYLRRAPVESWEMARSWCRWRCGDEVNMGVAAHTDGVYVWPEGYAHYVAVHHVRPPDGFCRHVAAVAGRLGWAGADDVPCVGGCLVAPVAAGHDHRPPAVTPLPRGTLDYLRTATTIPSLPPPSGAVPAATLAAAVRWVAAARSEVVAAPAVIGSDEHERDSRPAAPPPRRRGGTTCCAACVCQ